MLQTCDVLVEPVYDSVVLFFVMCMQITKCIAPPRLHLPCRPPSTPPAFHVQMAAMNESSGNWEYHPTVPPPPMGSPQVRLEPRGASKSFISSRNGGGGSSDEDSSSGSVSGARDISDACDENGRMASGGNGGAGGDGSGHAGGGVDCKNDSDRGIIEGEDDGAGGGELRHGGSNNSISRRSKLDSTLPMVSPPPPSHRGGKLDGGPRGLLGTLVPEGEEVVPMVAVGGATVGGSGGSGGAGSSRCRAGRSGLFAELRDRTPSPVGLRRHTTCTVSRSRTPSPPLTSDSGSAIRDPLLLSAAQVGAAGATALMSPTGGPSVVGPQLPLPALPPPSPPGILRRRASSPLLSAQCAPGGGHIQLKLPADMNGGSGFMDGVVNRRVLVDQRDENRAVGGGGSGAGVFDANQAPLAEGWSLQKAGLPRGSAASSSSIEKRLRTDSDDKALSATNTNPSCSPIHHSMAASGVGGVGGAGTPSPQGAPALQDTSQQRIFTPPGIYSQEIFVHPDGRPGIRDGGNSNVGLGGGGGGGGGGSGGGGRALVGYGPGLRGVPEISLSPAAGGAGAATTNSKGSSAAGTSAAGLGLRPKSDRRSDISSDQKFQPRKDYPPTFLLFKVACFPFIFLSL